MGGGGGKSGGGGGRRTTVGLTLLGRVQEGVWVECQGEGGGRRGRRLLGGGGGGRGEEEASEDRGGEEGEGEGGLHRRRGEGLGSGGGGRGGGGGRFTCRVGEGGGQQQLAQAPPLPRLLSPAPSLPRWEGCSCRHDDDGVLRQRHRRQVTAPVAVETPVTVVTHGEGGPVRLRGRGG